MKKLRTVQDKIRGCCVFLVVRKPSYKKPQMFMLLLLRHFSRVRL